MAALVEAVAAAAARRGVTIRTRSPVSTLAADGPRWRADGDPFDAVVLATPAAPTAPLVAPSAPDTARLLAQMDHAGVVLVTLAVANWPARCAGAAATSCRSRCNAP